MDYKEMYFKLFSEISDIIEQLQNIQNKYEAVYCDDDKKDR